MNIYSRKTDDDYIFFDVTAPLSWWNEFLTESWVTPHRVYGIRYYCKTGITADNFCWHDDYTRFCLDDWIKELNIYLFKYKETSSESDRDRYEVAFWDMLPQCFLDRRTFSVPRSEIALVLFYCKDRESGSEWREFIDELNLYN